MLKIILLLNKNSHRMSKKEDNPGVLIKTPLIVRMRGPIICEMCSIATIKFIGRSIIPVILLMVVHFLYPMN